MFARSLSLGPLVLKGRVLLAPLAGVSDVAFRRICQDHGAALTYVEMLNAVALLHTNRQTMAMLARDPSEQVLGVQVTGRKPEEVARAVAVLDHYGFETIDINMGCPARKVVNSGGGSAFLKDLARVAETVRLCRAATAKPLTVKCRIGYSLEEINIEETVRILVGEQIDMLTIHGRTRACDYGVPVDLEWIRRGLDRARTLTSRPLVRVGNGDVMDIESATQMMEVTGADAVMVSRGALGNPWIFRELITGERVRPTMEEWEAVVLRHLDYHEACHGDGESSARKTRKHLIWYASGFPRANRLRERLSGVNTVSDARVLVREFARSVPASYRRFDANEPSSARKIDYDPKFDMDRQLDRGVGDIEISGETPLA